jgi:hypothetical protein
MWRHWETAPKDGRQVLLRLASFDRSLYCSVVLARWIARPADLRLFGEPYESMDDHKINSYYRGLDPEWRTAVCERHDGSGGGTELPDFWRVVKAYDRDIMYADGWHPYDEELPGEGSQDKKRLKILLET